MRLTVKNHLVVATILSILAVSFTSAEGADAPSAKLVLSFNPVHKGTEIEVPTAKQLPKCVCESGTKGKNSGWVVIGAEGQVLRRFLDTNGDNIVDQWRYYHNGLEVYRDLDVNFNSKVDQSRWLNNGGSRWESIKMKTERLNNGKPSLLKRQAQKLCVR